MYITPRKTRLILPGKCAQVNGTLRKPKNMTSIRSTEVVTPNARWNRAAAGHQDEGERERQDQQPGRAGTEGRHRQSGAESAVSRQEEAMLKAARDGPVSYTH